MIELQNWIEHTSFPNSTWLLLGKGPTFAKIKEIDLSSYNTLSLNHVVREQKVNVAHIIDIDVVEACAKELSTNCDWLIMPRVPHVRGFASSYLHLSHWLECIPVLNSLEKQGKLITYTFSHEPVENDPWTISAKYFSSEAALEILGKMQVSTVRTLGIDGGTNYSEAFQDVQAESLLVNGQPSFDLQFPELNKIAAQYKIDLQAFYQLNDPSSKATTGEAWTRPYSSFEKANIDSAVNGWELQRRLNGLMRCINPTEARATHGVAPTVVTDKHATPSKEASLAAKIQEMEQDLRDTRAELAKTADQLQAVTKEFGICSERLEWAQNEINEYRENKLHLEKELHSLLKSKTWKFGRFLTKPAELVRQGISKKSLL